MQTHIQDVIEQAFYWIPILDEERVIARRVLDGKGRTWVAVAFATMLTDSSVPPLEVIDTTELSTSSSLSGLGNSS